MALALTLYLDDTDTHDAAPIVSLGGCIAPLESWAEFELFARKVYADVGITYLHAKKFHHNRGQFKEWNNDKKRQFVVRLFSKVRTTIDVGYSFSTVKGRYELRRKELGVNRQMPALGFCLWGIVDMMAKDVSLTGPLREQGGTVSVVLESGNHNNESLKSWVEHVRKKFKVEWLRPVAYVDKQESPAANIADFMAFYAARTLRYAIVRERDPAPPWYDLAFTGVRVHRRIATDFHVSDPRAVQEGAQTSENPQHQAAERSP